MAKHARLKPAISLREKLIMKDGNGFVIANFLETKLGSDALLQEVQRRPLEPDVKIGGRQKHCCPPNLAGMQSAFIDFFDLPIRKPVDIDQEE